MNETAKAIKNLADAVRYVGSSPNVSDSNLEEANLVDTTQRIAAELNGIRQAMESIAISMKKP